MKRHSAVNLRAGVTLIEVMLATVILSAGISALVLAATRALAVAGKAKEYETARRLIGQVDLEIPPNFQERRIRISRAVVAPTRVAAPLHTMLRTASNSRVSRCVPSSSICTA